MMISLQLLATIADLQQTRTLESQQGEQSDSVKIDMLDTIIQEMCSNESKLNKWLYELRPIENAKLPLTNKPFHKSLELKLRQSFLSMDKNEDKKVPELLTQFNRSHEAGTLIGQLSFLNTIKYNDKTTRVPRDEMIKEMHKQTLR